MERHWYRQKALLQAAVREHGSVAAAAEALDVPRTTVAHWAARFGIRSGHVKTPGALVANDRPRTGCTYVITAAGQPLYKIGRTGGDANARLASMQTGSPVLLELVCVLPHPAWEDVLHHHYRDKRRHGEWFELDRRDLAHIKRWAVDA